MSRSSAAALERLSAAVWCITSHGAAPVSDGLPASD
jgi:hypothetical protein